MLYRKWKVNDFAQSDVNSLCKELGVGTLLSKVLLSRAVSTKEQATTKYLDSAPLSDPFLMKDMDKKGVVLNSAFAVSGAFVFGDHLGFTAGFAPDWIPAMIVSKLVGGISAVAVALWLTKNNIAVDKNR